MQELIELYEMVSPNDAALRGSDKTAILKARLALRMFERAMEAFKTTSDEVPSAAEQGFRMPAQGSPTDVFWLVPLGGYYESCSSSDER